MRKTVEPEAHRRERTMLLHGRRQDSSARRRVLGERRGALGTVRERGDFEVFAPPFFDESGMGSTASTTRSG